ncbi:MAG: hypothetical protein K8R57_02175 [Verrucomicrobia bacterium]|nr:hypothetical protein [Verrucomicrobiota bacterium]
MTDLSSHAKQGTHDTLSPSWEVALLVIAALCYYAFYWRCGLMLSGEEGVAAVVAQRLNAGERPIVDTFLGYNVGWFYPIAWLFKLAGPNYLVLRTYFFLLGTLSGLSAYFTIRLVTRKGLIAVGTGLLVFLMPGVIGRNYMGLLGILGMLTILGVFLIPSYKRLVRPLQLLWMIAAGVSISLAWLIRIDLGFFQSILFLLTALLYLLKPEPGFLRRLGSAAIAILILIGSFLAIQGPVYRDAIQRGFGPQFAQQYWVWPSMIRNGACQLARQLSKPRNVPTITPAHSAISNESPSAQTSPSPTPVSHEENDSSSSGSYNDVSLKRPPLSDILHAPKFKDRVFALLIYLPVPVALLFIGWGLFSILSSWISRSLGCWQSGGILLVSTGSALVLFPQYFFWRPDMVHLAEFMVPFMVTLVIGLWLATSAWRNSTSGKRLLLVLIMLPAALDLGLYAIKGWQTDSAGSIAASRKRHLEFTALNGVHVKLNPQELTRDTLLRDTILSHSKPGDYVVCYPYFPMVNFMTDRPSYEYNLYADNALPSRQFFDQAKLNIERFHPTVIVIGTGKVNDTESSRFQNWASETYAYIKEHCTLVASDEEVEIYTLNQRSLLPLKKPPVP